MVTSGLPPGRSAKPPLSLSKQLLMKSAQAALSGTSPPKWFSAFTAALVARRPDVGLVCVGRETAVLLLELLQIGDGGFLLPGLLQTGLDGLLDVGRLAPRGQRGEKQTGADGQEAFHDVLLFGATFE